MLKGRLHRSQLRPAFPLYLNVALIVATSLLGLVGNYLTNIDDPPPLLNVLKSVAIPAFFVIVVLLIAGQIVLHDTANPKIRRREWDPGRPPYPGLEPYRESDAAVFYGRDQQISDIVKRLLSASESRLLVIVGASGSGKSSLVQAGVVPVLRTRRWVVLPVITPGSDPIGNLARAVSKALPTTTTIPSIVRTVRQNREIPARYVSEIRRAKGHRFSHVVLVLDQLEELFTITGEGDRALFLDVIEGLLAGDPRISVLASMRIEFLTQFLATDHSTLFQSPVAIGAIRSEYLTTAIEEPGRTADMTFAPNVVDRIVADVGGSGCGWTARSWKGKTAQARLPVGASDLGRLLSYLEPRPHRS